MNSSVIKILYDPELQLPVATTKARSILLSNANPVLAHGLQYILQSDQYLSNFNITVATNTDLEALVKISPDIVIIDAWQGAANWHKVAHHFEAFSRISSLICYCTDITSAEARAISAIGFRGVMPTSISPEELRWPLVAPIYMIYIGNIQTHHPRHQWRCARLRMKFWRT